MGPCQFETIQAASINLTADRGKDAHIHPNTSKHTNLCVYTCVFIIKAPDSFAAACGRLWWGPLQGTSRQPVQAHMCTHRVGRCGVFGTGGRHLALLCIGCEPHQHSVQLRTCKEMLIVHGVSQHAKPTWCIKPNNMTCDDGDG